jgi:hypothetical protein
LNCARAGLFCRQDVGNGSAGVTQQSGSSINLSVTEH